MIFMNYKIGNLKIKNRFFLAPMLEPNDIAFRLLCKSAGCGLTYTGMTSPLNKKKQILDDKPVLQIFANQDTPLKGISNFITKCNKKVSGFDLNLGCPSKLSGRLKHGIFLHKELDAIKNILKTMRIATKKPITIKLRKSVSALEIAKMAEKENLIDAIAIHPRTQKQGYSGIPDEKFALKLKKQSKLPIIYSGNADEKNAKQLLEKFDFVMLGRNAIGNPNIFAKLLNNKKRFSFKDYFKLAKKYNLNFRQIKFQAMNFTKGLKNAKELRREIVLTKNVLELKKIIS